MKYRQIPPQQLKQSRIMLPGLIVTNILIWTLVLLAAKGLIVWKGTN